MPELRYQQMRTADDKFQALEKAGVTTVRSPTELGDAIQKSLS